MKIFGYNYRITDFQCALGVSQLKKLIVIILKEKKLHPFKKNFKNVDQIKTQMIPKEFRFMLSFIS